MTVQALPYIILLGFLFGTSLIASRFSVGQFEPATYIGLRLTLAGLGHAAIYALVSRRHWPTDLRLWRHAAVLGLFGGLCLRYVILAGGIISPIETAGFMFARVARPKDPMPDMGKLPPG